VDADVEKRLFLLDDEPLALSALSRLAQSIGYEPVVASSLAEARSLLSSWSENAFALALIDNRLEDGSGMELLPELSILDPAPAVALVSGFLNSEIAARAFKGGAIPMARPADIQTLRELLELLTHLRKRTQAAADNSRRSSDPSIVVDAEPLVFGPFALSGNSLATPSGPRRLRHAESTLLAHLARRRPGVVCMTELAKVVLGRDDDGGRRSVYAHVTNLRLSLGPYAALIETEHKSGYRLALEFFAA
jgi:DNA-binding response OmpR family regulator